MTPLPRYAQLAATLRRPIASGTIKVGDLFPTELQLCHTHEVSRHTARAALQVLENDGLIERRPGFGTRVISAGASPTFHQPLGGFPELLQYARGIRLTVTSSEMVELADDDLERLKMPKGLTWLRLNGVRKIGRQIIAATTIYVLGDLGASLADFPDNHKPLVEVIEKHFGISVDRIEQSIMAENIESEDAYSMRTTIGQPILRTIRRYSEASGQIFLVSDTRHRADLFIYEMSYRRRNPKGK